MATLMKSSETELGSAGRNRALWLRDAAQSSIETAWQTEVIDHNLAEAALVKKPICPVEQRSHDNPRF